MNLFSFMVNAVTFGDVMFWIYALIVFVFVLGVIILLHEGGHFFFAKKAGILCHEYSLGMGPVIKSVKKGETSYSIRAVPIGGFVSMAGEDTNESMLQIDQEVSLAFKEVEESSLTYSKDGATTLQHRMVRVVSEISVTDKVIKDVTGTVKEYDLYSEDGSPMYIVLDVDGKEEKYLVARDAYYVLSEKQSIQMAPYERCYESKTKLQRFLTVFAGPLMNFVLAFFIFLIVGLFSGVPNLDSAEIGELSEGYHVTEVLQVGDVITAIDGNNVNSWSEVSTYLDSKKGQDSFEFTYTRNGTERKDIVSAAHFDYRLGVCNLGYEDYTGEGLKVKLLFEDNLVVGAAGMVDGDILLGYALGEYKSANEIPDKDWIKFENWNVLFTLMDKNPNMENIWIKYIHDGQQIAKESDVWTERSIKEVVQTSNNDTVVGISPTTHFDFFGGIGNAFRLFWNSITTVFVTLGALFSNSQVKVNMLSGPVGIFQAVKQYLGTDILSFLSFVGLISANIGLVNLLPLPALDGGRIVFIGYEIVTGKKVNKKVETALINVVFWLVMILFVYITFNDILRLF